MGFLKVWKLPLFCSITNSNKWKSMLNIIGVFYYIIMILIAATFEWFVILPELSHKLDFSIGKHRLFLLYLLVNGTGNYLLAASRDIHWKKSGNKKKRLTAEPFRSHHCKLCNICVLKHDHHCFIIGKCIGYHNQKHFIIFNMYTMLLSLYGLITLATYMHLVFKMEFAGALTFFTLFATSFMAWSQGSIGFPQVSLVLLLYICLMSALASFGFLAWELTVTSMGLTTHEMMSGTKGTNTSIRENFKDVFGQYWILGLFVPLPLPQYGTGCYEYVMRKPNRKHDS
ncbi:palmitoyltransferase ZDHHC22-like [Asterias amurensis]|uniref:palmitoyltransferase ZDHHC22-like n=1 Tax=Asterias amurensis TaxID=7602 RepID=UPI003AB283F6